MVKFSGVNKGYNAVANATNAINWLNNGSFTAYRAEMQPVEDLSLNRRNFEVLDTSGNPTVLTYTEDENTKRFDVLDVRLYKETKVLSFLAPEKAGSENIVGYWDIYGPAAVDVMPLDAMGYTITSRDGGNVIKISLTKSGVVLIDQPLTDLEALSGRVVTLAFSGRKMTSALKVTMSVIANGTELSAIQANSQLFGDYRRLTGEVAMPERVTSAVVRFKLEGAGGSSVGLSGCSLVLGAQARVPYTPSIPDLAVPSGIVFLIVGASCPSGFAQDAEMDNRLALVSGSAAPVVSHVPNLIAPEEPEVFTVAGSDTHDHADTPTAPVDTLSSASTDSHITASLIPADSQAAVHGVTFANPILFSTIPAASFVGQFSNEKSANALGVDHTHRLSSNMEAVPPSFGVRFCRKI
jgi:hypothetical protein